MKDAAEMSLEYNKTFIKNKKIFIDFNIYTTKKENLKEQVLKRLQKDSSFFNIVKINDKQVVLSFNDALWFDKSIKQIKDTEDRFKKRIVLNRLPYIILNNINSYDISKYIIGAFRNYLNKNKNIRDRVSNCIVQNIPVANYKFEFDGNIIITLKPEFRHNIIAVLKSRKNKELKKMDFDSSVYTILQCRRKK